MQQESSHETPVTGRGLVLVLCVVEVVLLALVPFPYWQDAVQGRWHFLTLLGCVVYFAMLLLTGIVFVQVRNRHTVSKSPLILAATLASIPVFKWTLVALGGMEVFHNRMGLGMEILGFIPNLVIDAGLFIGALGLLIAVWRWSARNSPSSA
jgi:1-acyl-sn-glycerol-3-phosphate acyltransferase